jgi:hypothetical protein
MFDAQVCMFVVANVEEREKERQRERALTCTMTTSMYTEAKINLEWPRNGFRMHLPSEKNACSM